MNYEKAEAEIITFLDNSSFMAASAELAFGHCYDFDWKFENYGEFECIKFTDNGKYKIKEIWTNEYKCEDF